MTAFRLISLFLRDIQHFFEGAIALDWKFVCLPDSELQLAPLKFDA